MPIFPHGMNDEELAKVIKEGALSVANNKISFRAFKEGMQELINIYGEYRIRNIRDNLIYNMKYPRQVQVDVYEISEIYIDELKNIKDFEKEIKPNNLYMQQQKLMQELSKHFDDKILQNIQQYIPPDAIKNIDYPPQIDYNNPQDDVSKDQNQIQGDLAMQGIDYVNTQRGPKAYKHMRAMLQAIWNIQHKHPDSRFDIDSKFAYDSNNLAGHIKANASVNEINAAHIDARAQYGGRGRPKGARNKDKVIAKDFSELDNLIEDLQGDDVKEDTKYEVVKLPDGQIDVSQLVTKPELRKAIADVSGSIVDVATEITKALQDSYRNLEDKVNNIQLHQPTLVEIKRNELPTVSLGVQHKTFPTLLKICTAQLRNGNRIIPWVYGPAGTGKSTAAENVAKALGLPYYSLGKTLAKFDLLGFINTTGYQTTEFRRAYENGGVFCADEMDAWSNEASVALNGALANGHCAFPDKSIKRHPDFVMITCANTTGAGATMDYVGRTKVDGATLDRFVSLFWALDEALEDSICANKDWLKYVRQVRAKANASGINPKPMITPRATIHGEALISAGLEYQTVVDICLRKGLSDAQWNLIK